MNNNATWQVQNNGIDVGNLESTSVTCSRPRGSFSQFPIRLPELALAMLVFTAPIAFYDPMSDLRRSGAATHLAEARKRRRRYITTTQAREIALRILVEAEQTRAAERLEEARLNATRWNEEDFS